MVMINQGLEFIKETMRWLPLDYTLSAHETGMVLKRIWRDDKDRFRERIRFVTYEEIESSNFNPFEVVFEEMQNEIVKCVTCKDAKTVTRWVDVFDQTIPEKHPCPHCQGN